MFRSAAILIVYICALVNSLSLSAGERSIVDRLVLNVDFETYFDNRENANAQTLRYRSGSDFASKLVPQIRYNFYGVHSLVGGVSWVQPFGDVGRSGGLLDDPYYNPLSATIYYSVSSDRWRVNAGLFPHSETMIGGYSTAFFADDYLFFDNVIGGVMGRNSWGKSSYVELICWWQSQPTLETREIFKLLTSANFELGPKFYAGYSFALTHFAGSEAEGVTNVVDNGLINPYFGFACEGEYKFDGRIGVLTALQRDRGYENEWLFPTKAEAGFSLSRWGFTLDERFYYGKDLMPLYEGHVDLYYADALYTGDPFFRADGVYNRAELRYERSFADDKVLVDVGFVTHLFEGSFNTEQRLRLIVKFDMKRK